MSGEHIHGQRDRLTSRTWSISLMNETLVGLFMVEACFRCSNLNLRDIELLLLTGKRIFLGLKNNSLGLKIME